MAQEQWTTNKSNTEATDNSKRRARVTLTKENKASTGEKRNTRGSVAQKNAQKNTKGEKMRYRTRGVPDVKSSRMNLKTHSGLGGIGTSETGTENALKGANNVPAAARKRSKLRHNISDIRTQTV